MSQKKWEKVDKAFEFLAQKYQQDETFKIEQLSEFTNWTINTVRTYITKRWDGFLLKVGREYKCAKRFEAFDKISFRQHHSQKVKAEKYFYQLLVRKSIIACISAIEIYNKPDFKFREETFSILMINAWELLLKAKILQLHNDDQTKIQATGKTSSGNPKTISIDRALNKLTSHIKPIVIDNICLLIEIRNEAIHFVHNDPKLNVKIQQIGTASLRNFMNLARSWFGCDFSQFNFYLMPISFFHQSDIDSYSIDNMATENLLNHFRKIEESYNDELDPEFSIALILQTKFIKTSDAQALPVRLTNEEGAIPIHLTEEEALKSYKLTYSELCRALRKNHKNFKQNKDFHEQKRRLEGRGEEFCKVRKLNPNNPKSQSQRFYHSRIIEEFGKYYQSSE